MQASKRSIVKDSERIRKLLKERFDDQRLRAKDIVVDANEKGLNINESSLSRYLNHGNTRSSISEEAIIWLCFRYGIQITLLIGKPVLKEKRLVLELPRYNEEECLTKLKQVFPWEKQQIISEQQKI